MKKVELLEAEVATLSDLTNREIERVTRERREELRETMVVQNGARTGLLPETMDYYTMRLHMLRQLKAKLEREEE